MRENKYPMPALTEQEREELIEVAKNDLSQWGEGGHYCRILKIALAALTVKPEYNVIKNGTNFIVPKSLYDDFEGMKWVSYPEPPVPVLKKVDLSGVDYLPGYQQKWLSGKEVAAAIRTAGYGVKDD